MKDLVYVLAFVIFSAFVCVFISKDSKKYKKNNPYAPIKNKNLFYRILLGLMAGIHYFHFVGTYNHKKYNTQVFTPETLECYLGVFFATILWVVYLALVWYLKDAVGMFSLSILLIPIITNIISFIRK